MPDGTREQRTVTIQLDADLIDAAARRDGDIGLSIRRALSRYVGSAPLMTQAEIEALASDANAFHAENGIIGEEFSFG